MSAHLLLVRFLVIAIAYGLGLGAAMVLARALSGPWRRASGAHWTERARRAYGPGYALVWLAVFLPLITVVMAEISYKVLHLREPEGAVGFWWPWLGAFGGVLTARYFWFRELWGNRVTVRSWLASWLVLVFVLIPHIVILMLLMFLLPNVFNGRSVALLGAGVLGLALFEAGAGVWLLRFIGVIRPASSEVTDMVEQLAQAMGVRGWVRVFELEWAQVNAVAWTSRRAVGFSRALLEVMTPEEVRAIAAHEIGHLLEPAWVRGVRVAHEFAYLAVAPVINYGGPYRILVGWVLLMAIILGFRQFMRRMEVQADRREREAIADGSAYMRSMVKLHEANCLPAVMPGSQTHPHLYDRLLAGGLEPDFPRPKAPSRVKPLLAVFSMVIAVAGVVFLLLVGIMVVLQLSGI